MHLSYIIAVLTTVGKVVCAIPDLQQLKSLSVADVVQPPVQITQSDPGVSKRSLRVHKLEDEEDDGEEDEGDEENKDEGDEEDRLSPTEEERVFAFSFFTGLKPFAGKSTLSTVEKRYPLSTTSGAQAGRVSMQPATKIAPKGQSVRTRFRAQDGPLAMQPATKSTSTLKSVDEGKALTAVRRDELVWGPKTVQKLDDVAKPAVGRYTTPKQTIEHFRLARKYKTSLADPKMTAKKFRTIVDKDDLKRGVDPDVIYSTAYLSRWLDDIQKHKEFVKMGEDLYKRLSRDLDALKRFGPLMDETRHIDDIAGALGRRAAGATDDNVKTADLLVEAHHMTKSLDRQNLSKLILVEKAVKKEQKAVGQKVEEYADEAIMDKWDLQTMMKKLEVTDQTPRNSVQYKALNGLITRRIKNDLVVKPETARYMDEAFDVVADLEKNKLAQKYLADAMSKKPEDLIKKDMGIGRPGLSEGQQVEAAQAWVTLLRARQLGRHIGL